jgi:hypothetical protein
MAAGYRSGLEMSWQPLNPIVSLLFRDKTHVAADKDVMMAGLLAAGRRHAGWTCTASAATSNNAASSYFKRGAGDTVHLHADAPA